MSNNIKTGTGLQGLTRIITDATIEVTDLVEAMHKRVIHPPFLPSTPIQHLITNIAGFTYKNIKWSTRLIGSGLEKVFKQLSPIFGELKTTTQRAIMRSALNGVVGDYLENTENPLQIKMQFRDQLKAISLDTNSLRKAYSANKSKILLLVHGSCMSDLQWTRKEHNHGIALAKKLGFAPIYLHYNSGRHISTNGQNFNELLEDLVLNWPGPIEEIAILAHSMGGLVIRSALHYGQQQHKKWTKHLQKIIFLGTPHHGAPLEQIGNYIDLVLESIPYTKPLARLAKIRSAGITDLRYGNLVDEDWQDEDRFKLQGDQRKNIPLPNSVECFSIAAATRKKTAPLSSRFIGDRLVTVKSALGQHRKTAKKLNFKEDNTWIAYEHNHLDLLNSPEVYDKIEEWISSANYTDEKMVWV